MDMVDVVNRKWREFKMSEEGLVVFRILRAKKRISSKKSRELENALLAIYVTGWLEGGRRVSALVKGGFAVQNALQTVKKEPGMGIKGRRKAGSPRVDLGKCGPHGSMPKCEHVNDWGDCCANDPSDCPRN